mmetsp:Transcript_18389/g.45731  ORF Transcript_18389/g.45731 Transcript_18389/m.45731 type:complete len:242 (-) Transcript_18389:1962-2687(-)
MVQHCKLAAAFIYLGVHMEVDHSPGGLQRGELVEVCGEQARRLDLVHDVLRDGPRQAEAVVGRGATTQLVDDDEGRGGGRLQDGGGLKHLSHERGDATELAVAGAHPRKDGVPDLDLGAVAWHEGPHLGQEHDDTNLADERGLAAHVGARDDLEPAAAAAKRTRVGDELNAVLRLHARVPAALQHNLSTAILPLLCPATPLCNTSGHHGPHEGNGGGHCHLGEAGQDVDLGAQGAGLQEHV